MLLVNNLYSNIIPFIPYQLISHSNFPFSNAISTVNTLAFKYLLLYSIPALQKIPIYYCFSKNFVKNRVSPLFTEGILMCFQTLTRHSLN